jgi:hypothetical protein
VIIKPKKLTALKANAKRDRYDYMCYDLREHALGSLKIFFLRAVK